MRLIIIKRKLFLLHNIEIGQVTAILLHLILRFIRSTISDLMNSVDWEVWV